MEFISKKHIYHGDLAARNILLTDQLVAKISDFGLSQRLYQSISSSTSHSGNVGYMQLPIKWLALEVLMHGQATTKSDIWSYGVLVWEILHLGAEPYRSGKLIYIYLLWLMYISNFKSSLDLDDQLYKDFLFRYIL